MPVTRSRTLKTGWKEADSDGSNASTLKTPASSDEHQSGLFDCPICLTVGIDVRDGWERKDCGHRLCLPDARRLVLSEIIHHRRSEVKCPLCLLEPSSEQRSSSASHKPGPSRRERRRRRWGVSSTDYTSRRRRRSARESQDRHDATDKSVWSATDVLQLLRTRQHQRLYYKQTLEHWMNKTKDLKRCPRPGCAGAVMIPKGRVHCLCPAPGCDMEWCGECSLDWHPHLTCEQASILDRNAGLSSLHRLIDEQKWAMCPTCHRVVERTEGCNAMVCVCETSFCYACSREYPWCTCYGAAIGNRILADFHRQRVKWMALWQCTY